MPRNSLASAGCGCTHFEQRVEALTMASQTKPWTSLRPQMLTPLAHALTARTLVLLALVVVPTAGAGDAPKYTSQSVLGPAQDWPILTRRQEDTMERR